MCICICTRVCIYGTFSFVGLEKHIKARPFSSCHHWQVWGASVSCRFRGYGNEMRGNGACPANCADGLPLPSLWAVRVLKLCSSHVCCTRVGCATQQACVPCDSRHVYGVTEQTCLLCDAAHMSAVSRSRHVCCVLQQTCLPGDAADMSAASHD